MNRVIRRVHRWTSLAFLLVVGGIFSLLGLGQQPAQWVYYLPLAPLFVLALSGTIMLVQPVFAARASGAGTGAG